MQKSIRRGETEIAQRAALTLLKLRGSAIWRRFMVIAFEDVGIGGVDAVTLIVAAGSDAAWRKACGGDLRVAVHLAGVLAQAPKDRSADHLAGAKDHPALAGFAQAMASASIALCSPMFVTQLSICRTERSQPGLRRGSAWAMGPARQPREAAGIVS